MGDHVHVLLSREVGVSTEGDLVEQFRCRCGETRTRIHPVEPGELEQ
ncbi:hypothetical protein [Kitasatospora sp. NPDC085879]